MIVIMITSDFTVGYLQFSKLNVLEGRSFIPQSSILNEKEMELI